MIPQRQRAEVPEKRRTNVLEQTDRFLADAQEAERARQGHVGAIEVNTKGESEQRAIRDKVIAQAHAYFKGNGLLKEFPAWCAKVPISHKQALRIVSEQDEEKGEERRQKRLEQQNAANTARSHSDGLNANSETRAVRTTAVPCERPAAPAPTSPPAEEKPLNEYQRIKAKQADLATRKASIEADRAVILPITKRWLEEGNAEAWADLRAWVEAYGR